MPKSGFTSPREASCAFTTQLSVFVETPLFDTVWADPVLIALGRRNKLATHLRRAVDNRLSKAKLSAAVTPLAFCPAAIDASMSAAKR